MKNQRCLRLDHRQLFYRRQVNYKLAPPPQQVAKWSSISRLVQEGGNHKTSSTRMYHLAMTLTTTRRTGLRFPFPDTFDREEGLSESQSPRHSIGYRQEGNHRGFVPRHENARAGWLLQREIQGGSFEHLSCISFDQTHKEITQVIEIFSSRQVLSLPQGIERFPGSNRKPSQVHTEKTSKTVVWKWSLSLFCQVDFKMCYRFLFFGLSLSFSFNNVMVLFNNCLFVFPVL